MSPAYDNSEHSGVLVFIVPPVDLEINGFQNLYGRLTWLKRALNTIRFASFTVNLLGNHPSASYCPSQQLSFLLLAKF